MVFLACVHLYRCLDLCSVLRILLLLSLYYVFIYSAAKLPLCFNKLAYLLTYLPGIKYIHSPATTRVQPVTLHYRNYRLLCLVLILDVTIN